MQTLTASQIQVVGGGSPLAVMAYSSFGFGAGAILGYASPIPGGLIMGSFLGAVGGLWYGWNLHEISVKNEPRLVVVPN